MPAVSHAGEYESACEADRQVVDHHTRSRRAAELGTRTTGNEDAVSTAAVCKHGERSEVSFDLERNVSGGIGGFLNGSRDVRAVPQDDGVITRTTELNGVSATSVDRAADVESQCPRRSGSVNGSRDGSARSHGDGVVACTGEFNGISAGNGDRTANVESYCSGGTGGIDFPCEGRPALQSDIVVGHAAKIKGGPVRACDRARACDHNGGIVSRLRATDLGTNITLDATGHRQPDDIVRAETITCEYPL